jgi:SAM-dependent methyltransferase
VKTNRPLARPTSEFATHNSLRSIAHSRLYPSLTDPSYLVLRSRRLIFSKWIKQMGRANLTILDIGGRYQPYRELFGSTIKHYVSLDLVKTDMVDVIADGQALPLAPGSFDVVIATQVLDYLLCPAAALREIHTVLKPGGSLIASAPACAPSFAEAELWRFTRSGLCKLFEPFAHAEIVPELHSAASLVRTLNLAIDGFVHYPSARWLYRRTMCPLLNLFGLAIEKLSLTSNDQFAANYSVLATKAK